MRLHVTRGEPDTLKTLHPAYFALVMATGIVAIALHEHAVPILPALLFALNLLFLAVLMVANGLRLWRYPDYFLADIRSHSRGVGFLPRYRPLPSSAVKSHCSSTRPWRHCHSGVSPPYSGLSSCMAF